MNREHELFPLSDDQIFAAERQRAIGSVATAIEAVRPAIEFPLERFLQLSDDDKKRLLMASRIYVVGSNSQANRSWEAPSVAYYLGQTREAIVEVYRNSNIQRAAEEIKEDTKGNPYEFKTEMAGDEVAYTLTLAALTGNAGLLNFALERMDTIIKNSQEPTARTLAEFRKARLVFRSTPTRESFNNLKQSYQETTRASATINRWERVATVASRYAIDSISSGHPLEALKGKAMHVRAALKDRSTTTILPREVAKAVTEATRHKIWQRTTPANADYTALRLPE